MAISDLFKFRSLLWCVKFVTIFTWIPLIGNPGPIAKAFFRFGNLLNHYFVRIGTLGEIRVASALAPLVRGRRVVVRSPRGIEVAEVISERRIPLNEDSVGPPNYRIVRPTTESDELLVTRLDRYKRQAVESCRARLKQQSSDAMLLDVDQLLDGGTLRMHFLGVVDADAQAIADEIARDYESIVRTNHLAQLLTDGCGPACGTTASGCGSGSGCGSKCAGCGD